MPIKFRKIEKMRFFLMSQGSIRFLGQKVCPVARARTDRQTDKQTDTKVNTDDTLSSFQDFFLYLSSRIGPTQTMTHKCQL